MDERYDKNACQEAYVIVNFLVENGEIVVSQDLIEFLENNRNTEYKFDLNDINNRELLLDTEKILAKVYIECIATKSEKAKIIKSLKTLHKTILKEDYVEKNTGLSVLRFRDKLKQRLFSTSKD